MTNPTAPGPPDRDQHAPGISKTLEENATRFRETTTEERMEPKLRPVIPSSSEKTEQREEDRSL